MYWSCLFWPPTGSFRERYDDVFENQVVSRGRSGHHGNPLPNGRMMVSYPPCSLSSRSAQGTCSSLEPDFSGPVSCWKSDVSQKKTPEFPSSCRNCLLSCPKMTRWKLKFARVWGACPTLSNGFICISPSWTAGSTSRTARGSATLAVAMAGGSGGTRSDGRVAE